MYFSLFKRTTGLLAALVITAAAGYAQTNYYVSPLGNDANSGLSGFPKKTINAAIVAASNADTVNVAAGTYNENVLINKSITLKGANYNVSCTGLRLTESVVSGVGGSTLAAIQIAANGVTVNGLTATHLNGSYGILIQGTSNINIRNNVVTNVGNSVSGSSSSFGIFDEVASAAGNNSTDVTIANNCISDIRGGANNSLSGAAARSNNGIAGGIGVGSASTQSSVSGVTISDNTIDDITASTKPLTNGGKGAYGVFISIGADLSAVGKAVNLRVTNNAITDLDGLWAHGVGLEGETPGAMVLNNYLNKLTDHSNGDATGVTIQDNAGAATVQVHENSFTKMVNGIVNTTTATVDATCNWYGNAKASNVASMVLGNVIYTPWMSNGTDNSTVTGFQPVPNSCNGCSSGNVVQNKNNLKFYCSIQEAIDDPATLSGDTILASAGKYDENVVINKSITLKGSNYNVTCEGSRPSESQITGGGGAGTATISIDANGVTVDGFKIRNPKGEYGILISGRSNINIQHNIITDVGDDAAGSGSTYAVFDQITSAAGNNSSNVNVSNNCLNEIRGGENKSLSGAAAQSNNGSGVGIGFGDSQTQSDVSGVTINGNSIEKISASKKSGINGGKGAYGVLFNIGAASTAAGKAVSPQITNNEIDDLEGLWVHGVGLEGETPGAMVLNNLMSHFDEHNGDATGVLIQGNDGATTVQIHENSFTKMRFGIANAMPAAPVDGTCNWYGNAKVATVAAMVKGNVQYTPWLSNGADNSPATGFQPVPNSCNGCPSGNVVQNRNTMKFFCSIQEAIDDPSTQNGDTIVALAGNYSENVVINKSITLKGANYKVNCDGGRAMESIITGSGGAGTATISIDADDVIVDGLMIKNPKGEFGIQISGRSDINIQHNIITDVGDDVSGSGATYAVYDQIVQAAGNISANLNISHNCIDEIRGGENTSLSGAAARSNNGSGVGIGFGDSQAQSDVVGIIVDGNTIEKITASTSNLANGGKGAYGVLINVGASPSAAGEAIIPQVSDNVINDLEGLWVHGVGLEGETPIALVLNNLMRHFNDHNGGDAAGVSIQDNPWASTLLILENSFTEMRFGVVNATPDSANATCNWFGSANAGTVASRVLGPVIYKPWLSNGTDISPAIGFQPAPGSCGQQNLSRFIADAEESSDVKVYPNPSNGVFYVELPETSNQSIVTVTDLQGKVITQKTVAVDEARKINLDLGNVARGVYFLEVTYGDQRFRMKVVVQ